MPLSAKKRTRLAHEKRIANVRAVAYKSTGLISPFMDANWDAEARRYMDTGEIREGSHLAFKFASAGIVA